MSARQLMLVPTIATCCCSSTNSLALTRFSRLFRYLEFRGISEYEPKPARTVFKKLIHTYCPRGTQPPSHPSNDHQTHTRYGIVASKCVLDGLGLHFGRLPFIDQHGPPLFRCGGLGEVKIDFRKTSFLSVSRRNFFLVSRRFFKCHKGVVV